MQLTSKKSMRSLLALSLVAVLGSWGCSGGQQDEENLEATEDNQQANNVGADDAGEGNGQENYENNNEQANDSENAEVNNDTANDAADGGEAADVGNPTLDGGAAPIQNASAAPAPMEAAPAVAAPSEGAPVPGGRVRYVKAGGVQVVSAPGGGQPVMTLEQGEHPVTWEENGYLRITNGMYVPIDAMSDKGVPRPGQHSGDLAH